MRTWGGKAGAAVGAVVTGVLVLSACGSAEGGDAAQLTAATSVRVVAVGDIACKPGAPVTRTTCRQGATAKAALALDPVRVLALGDLQYEKGRYRAFNRSYAKSWGKLRAITWPIPGNHEYYTTGARGYYRYFAGQLPGAPAWYRKELNGWQMYFLNSNCTKVDCAAQRAWLDAEMAKYDAPETCSLVAFHHPRYSSGEHRSNARMRGFWNIAMKHGADLALSGHDHNYERFAPMNATGGVDTAAGIRQFVSGGGGKNLRPRGVTVPGSERFLKRFGVLELNLTPTSYSWKFRGIKLGVRDSGSAVCR